MSRKGKIEIGASVTVKAKEDGSLSEIEKRIDKLSNEEIEINIKDATKHLKELEKMESALGKKVAGSIEVQKKHFTDLIKQCKQEQKLRADNIKQIKQEITTEKELQKIKDKRTKTKEKDTSKPTKRERELTDISKKIKGIKGVINTFDDKNIQKTEERVHGLIEELDECQTKLDAMKRLRKGNERTMYDTAKSEIADLRKTLNAIQPIKDSSSNKQLNTENVAQNIREGTKATETFTAATNQETKAIKDNTAATKKNIEAKKQRSKIKVREFTQEEYETHSDQYEKDHSGDVESLNDTLDIVRKVSEFGTQFSADLTTSCSKALTAVKRFFAALDPDKYPALTDWKDGILESVENGYFSQKSTYNGMYTGEYSWGVEFPDEGTAYVWLNILDVAKDKEKEYSAYLDEESKKRDEGLEREADLLTRLRVKWKQLDELRDNKPERGNDQIKFLEEIIYYYEKEKNIIQDILELKKRFESIPGQYKNLSIGEVNSDEYAYLYERITKESLAHSVSTADLYREDLDEAKKKLEAKQVEKLTSSYEGLADAVERYTEANKKMWAAYKNASPDFEQLAQERNAIVAEISKMFPELISEPTYSRSGIEMRLQAQEFANVPAKDTLGYLESALKKAETEISQNKMKDTAQVAIRTVEQINAELESEKQKLKEIDTEIKRNDSALEAFHRKQQHYGKEVLGVDAQVYDVDLLQAASVALAEFNNLLGTRNKFQEKYIRLQEIISKYYIGENPPYAIGQGLYKNLDQYISNYSSMRQLDSLFQQGQKTTNKYINGLFDNIIVNFRSEISTISSLLSSGDVIGARVGKELEEEEIRLNQTTQRLLEERDTQLSKINALREEELDLIKKQGQAEKVNEAQFKFANGTALNEKETQAVKKYCEILKKSMGDAYNEAQNLKAALNLVFNLKTGNVESLMDRFNAGNKASNAALKLMTGMPVNNQENRDFALRSINPTAYDQIIAEQKATFEAAMESQKSEFQTQWDAFVAAMLGEGAFNDETNLVKGKILKAFSQYGITATEAIDEINKAWLSGDLDGKTAKSKYVQDYIDYLDELKEHYDELRNVKAGDLDVDSLFDAGGTRHLTEEKAQSLRNEAAAWDELISKKKEYYGITTSDTGTKIDKPQEILALPEKTQATQLFDGIVKSADTATLSIEQLEKAIQKTKQQADTSKKSTSIVPTNSQALTVQVPDYGSQQTANSIETATTAIKNEGVAAEQAASKKKKFTDANAKVAESGQVTKSGIDEASGAMENEGKSAQEYADEITNILARINSLNTEIGNLGKKNQSGIFSGQIDSMQKEKSNLLTTVASIAQEVNDKFKLGFGKDVISNDSLKVISEFFKQSGESADISGKSVNNFIDILRNAEKVASEINNKYKESFDNIQRLRESINKATEDFNDVDIDDKKDNGTQDYYDSVFARYEKALEQYDIVKQSLASPNPIDWSGEEFSQVDSAIANVERYGNAIKKIQDIEQKYFASKQKYTQDTTMQSMAEDAQKAAEEVSTAQAKLTQAAEQFAKESGMDGVIVTKFVQNANGIAKLDFSVLDEGTNALRKFSMEMGRVNPNNLYLTENTLSNTASKAQAAGKQLETVTNTIQMIQNSGLNMDLNGVQKLLDYQNQLKDALKNGSNTSNSTYTAIINGAKMACSEVDKLYKKHIQLQEAVNNKNATALKNIDLSNSETLTNQITESIKNIAAGGTDLKIGALNQKTGELKFSFVDANNTLQEFTLSLDAMGKQAVVQQTNVQNLGSKFDQFKAGLTKTAKQFGTALVGANVFYKVISEIRQGVNYVKEIDLAMTELKKVTDETTASYDNFLSSASERASKLGSTVSDFTEATANFARLNI